MDAPGPMDSRYIPLGLTPSRGYRWCLARTLRDLRHATRRGRAISLPNACRLFSRRWHRTARRCMPRPDDIAIAAQTQQGATQLRALLLTQQRTT